MIVPMASRAVQRIVIIFLRRRSPATFLDRFIRFDSIHTEPFGGLTYANGYSVWSSLRLIDNLVRQRCATGAEHISQPSRRSANQCLPDSAWRENSCLRYFNYIEGL